MAKDFTYEGQGVKMVSDQTRSRTIFKGDAGGASVPVTTNTSATFSATYESSSAPVSARSSGIAVLENDGNQYFGICPYGAGTDGEAIRWKVSGWRYSDSSALWVRSSIAEGSALLSTATMTNLSSGRYADTIVVDTDNAISPLGVMDLDGFDNEPSWVFLETQGYRYIQVELTCENTGVSGTPDAADSAGADYCTL